MADDKPIGPDSVEMSKINLNAEQFEDIELDYGGKTYRVVRNDELELEVTDTDSERLELEHSQWDRTDVAGWNNHWRHVDPDEGEPESIVVADESVESLSGHRSGWTVELYPNPDHEAVDNIARWHYSQDEYDDPRQEAVERAEIVMEEHA